MLNNFFGPHLGLAYVRAGLASQWRTYKVRPATHPFETGTLAHERTLGQRFLDGLPGSCTLHGLHTMDGRVPTFAFTVEGRSPRSVAEGAVRAGFVHYNTADEVDRLLHALDEL